MAKQTVTLRLDEDDLTYLARTDLPGASNLSEKIRVLLAQARAQHQGLNDYDAAYAFTRRLFDLPERALRGAEVRVRQRSELVARILSWLPDIAAYVLSGAGDERIGGDPEHSREALREFEQGLGERVLALTDSVLQLAQAGFPGCYAPQALAQRAQPAVATTATPAASIASGGQTSKPTQ